MELKEGAGMTKREKEIIDILKKEPMISQNELAGRLGISRSSVAVHITNLMKKEIIAGKGYVIREEHFVAVLGGANVDILGNPSETFKAGDSNPGTVLQSLGGVGRNIAENLGKLEVPVRFLTLVGDDANGEWIIQQTGEAGVDMSHVHKDKIHSSGIYLSVQDEAGEMIAAISQMAIYDEMGPEYLESVMPVLQSASRIVVDTNLSEAALRHVAQTLGEKELILDTVSSKKAMRVRDIIGRFATVKPNRVESEILTGITITDDASLRASANWYFDQGVRRVFISMGSEGTFAASRSVMGKVTSRRADMKNANGAGDAFIAALVMTSLETDDIREWAKNGVASAISAISSETTINRDLSLAKINEIKKEYQIEWKNL